MPTIYKRNFDYRKKALGLYFCGILDPGAVQDCKKFPVNNKCTPAISERYHQRSMLSASWKTSWATKKIFQMLMFALQKKIWKMNY